MKKTALSRKDLLILAVLLLSTTLVYINGLHNPFIPDDIHIIRYNFFPRPNWTISDMFRLSLFPAIGRETAYYRPLTLLTFATNYDLFADQPWGYRSVNLAIHLAVVGLAYLLLSQFTLRWIAAFASLLFALHPANVQAITYISSRSDPLYTAFVLLCLLFWYHGSSAKGARRAIFLSAAITSFFLGLLSKEPAIVAPFLVFGMDVVICTNPETRIGKLKEKAFWYLGFVLALAVYLYIRLNAGYPLLMERGGGPDFGTRILFALKLFSHYLALAFYPIHLSAFRMVPYPKFAFEAEVMVGAIFLGGFILLAYFYRSRRREVSCGILWYLISLLPALNLTRLNAPMMEHWLYLPLIGLALALVRIIYDLAERTGEIRGAAFGLCFLALLLSARTVTRNAEWGNLVKLFSHDVAQYPNHERAWAWLGDAHKVRGEWKNAISSYRKSLQINPRMTQNWVALGNALSMAGEDAEAEEILSKSVASEPKNPWYRYFLGLHFLKVGKNRDAIDVLKENASLNPPLPMSYHALGSAYLRIDDSKAAEAQFQRAQRSYHGNKRYQAGFHVVLGKVFAEQGEMKEAREEWQLALRFDPSHEEALRLLSQGSN